MQKTLQRNTPNKIQKLILQRFERFVLFEVKKITFLVCRTINKGEFPSYKRFNVGIVFF